MAIYYNKITKKLINTSKEISSDLYEIKNILPVEKINIIVTDEVKSVRPEGLYVLDDKVELVTHEYKQNKTEEELIQEQNLQKYDDAITEILNDKKFMFEVIFSIFDKETNDKIKLKFLEKYNELI